MEHTQQKQITEALMQLALTESEAIFVRLAEIIVHAKRKEYLAALGTFQGLDEQFKFLGSELEVTARIPRP